jgi:predicted O-methyltransferase YrrM
MAFKALRTLRRVFRRNDETTHDLRIDESIPGWMTRPELEVIARAARAVPANGTIVEIGSYAGRSSVHWAANSDPSVEIFCIDPFDAVIDDFSFAHIQGDASNVRDRPSGEIFAEQTRDWAHRLTPLAQLSPPATWERPADVIFVDGDHTAEGVTRDLRFWIDHLKPGARLLGHDWDDARVREAVEAFAAERGLTASPHDGTNIWELR